jgi:hypothetical protein
MLTLEYFIESGIAINIKALIVDPLTGVHFTITHDGFEAIIKTIKAQYTIAYALMIIKLECRFLDHELMDTLQILYPQYISCN